MEPLIHFVVPFTAMTLAGVKRKALPISLLALFQSLDAPLFTAEGLILSAFLLTGLLKALGARWRC